MTFEHRIRGIPCLIDVTHVKVVRGDPSTWASDIDYHGYSEVEFEVLDRRGRKADWLTKKMTQDDICEIEQTILERNEHERDHSC